MRTDFKINLRTPIWTGDARGRADGLKDSGVIGGLRQAFEMLIRQYGGSTCNPTGAAEQRCNYEADKAICPACAVFGCTGLQRSFKLNFDLAQTPVQYPDADAFYKNRNHDNKEYNFPVYIGKWMAVSAGCKIEMKNLNERQAAGFIKDNVRVAYLPNGSSATQITLLALNTFLSQRDLNLPVLFAHLLCFMSRYRGLGAKVNQGWGVFDPDFQHDDESGREEFAKLIGAFPYEMAPAGHDLPSAENLFVAEWRLKKSDPGFKWADKQLPDTVYRAVGYGLSYRLRRCVKFYEVDNSGDKLPIDGTWRALAENLKREKGPWASCPWREAVPFVRALFGRDNAGEDNKSSGLVGVSHVFSRDRQWYVRLHGRLDPSCLIREIDGNKRKLDWDRNQVRNFLILRMNDILDVAGCRDQSCKPEIVQRWRA